MNADEPGRTRVAVLLPVRDGAATIRAALESLRAQTFRDFRVIAVDDGSADDTPGILREELVRWGGLAVEEDGMEDTAPALTIVRLDPGAGIAGALAVAARAAGEVELLARQDADDRSHPQRFARQVEFLDSHPQIGLVATGVRTTRARNGVRHGAVDPGLPCGRAAAPDADPMETTDGWRRYERWLAECVTPEQIARSLWIESPLPHPTVMMRRCAYERVGGYREVPWPEDYDLWLRMLCAGIAMGKIADTLYDWTDHPLRASRRLTEYSPEAFHACRAHHLARYLDGRCVVVWGAGRDGRRSARAMLRQGIDIRAFLDIDPRKIGRRAYGRPILDAEEWLASWPDPAGSPPLVLAAVGTAGARDLIRARLGAAGLAEGPDFLCIA